MVTDDLARAMSPLIDLIKRADAKPPRCPGEISRRLADTFGRMDLRMSYQETIRTVVSGRLVGAGLFRQPKVVFTVMDIGVAVLGGVHWSGFVRPEPTDIDVTVPWSDVVKIHFRFPEWLCGLGIISTDRLETSTGPYEIILVTRQWGEYRVAADEDDFMSFIGAARKTAELLDSMSQPDAAGPVTDSTTDSERLARGLLRYLPEQLLSSDKPALVACSAVTKQAELPGFALIAHDLFWFFDHNDCLVPDIRDGDPAVFKMADITGCSVLRHDSYPLPGFRKVEIMPVSWPDPRVISVIVEAKDCDLALAIPAGADCDAGGRQAHQANVAQFLRLIDEAI